MSRVLLLGPQRFDPTVGDAVRSLGVDGPIATINAGWQEREPDDAELDELLDGRSVNLSLFRRWLDVTERDPEFATADRRRQDILDELQAVYLLRLHHAVDAVTELQRRAGDNPVWSEGVNDAVEAIRALDARHLERVREVHAEFHHSWPPHERPGIAEHRAAIASQIAQTSALAIAGGHVGVLLSCLHLFNIGAALQGRPVVAWSAGAMALAETVVLFHDRAVHGHGHPEVYDSGLALARGVVPLPHARRRLRLHDTRRMSLFARRFAPAVGLVLEDGVRVEFRDGICCPPGSPVVGLDGTVGQRAA